MPAKRVSAGGENRERRSGAAAVECRRGLPSPGLQTLLARLLTAGEEGIQLARPCAGRVLLLALLGRDRENSPPPLSPPVNKQLRGERRALVLGLGVGGDLCNSSTVGGEREERGASLASASPHLGSRTSAIGKGVKSILFAHNGNDLFFTEERVVGGEARDI